MNENGKLYFKKFVLLILLSLAQMPYSGAPAQNPVPEQSQAAFVPSLMNQYPADPSAVQPADPNMGMNAVAKTNIPESTQVRGSCEARLKGAQSRLNGLKSLTKLFNFVVFQSVSIFSFLVTLCFVIISLVFFFLCKVLFSGFLQFNSDFVDAQNNSKYRD